MDVVKGEGAPPRGWNSWDSFGPAVTEHDVLANSRFMAEHLLPFGWDTVVIDIQWYEPDARAGGYNEDADLVLDEFGRPLPAVNRFPSAAHGAGFAPIAARVHELGLRFGIHIMRGIPRRAVAAGLPVLGTDATAADIADLTSPCPWNTDNWGLDHDHPGADAYYRSLAALFAQWGVDFVKADDMLWPYHEREIESLSRALRSSGRAMELSLSPGVEMSTARAGHLAEHADMWRISNDLWDEWRDVEEQFGRLARWAPFSRPGARIDADMLPLGHIGISAERGGDRMSKLTISEQRTLMSLWSIVGSPLFMGGDLPTSAPETIALLTNPLVLEIDARSSEPRELVHEHDHALWRARLDDREVIAVFALGDERLHRDIPLAQFGVEGATRIIDAWTGAHLAFSDTLPVDLDRHDVLLAVVEHG